MSIQCGRCHLNLEYRASSLRYLDHTIEVEVLTCPKCGQIFIPESLAKGKMAEVEQILEDK